MTIRIAPCAALRASENIEAGSDFVGRSQVNLGALDLESTARTIEGDHPVMGAVLAGGDTLDLTAAPIARDPSATHDYTGATVVAMLLRAPAENAGDVTLGDGALNAYTLDGEFTLAPGQVIVADGMLCPDVAAGAKELDLAGDPGDELQVMLVLEEEAP